MTISSFSAENSLETAEFLLKHEIKCVSLIQKLKDSPSEVFIFRNTKTNAIAGIISVSAGGSILHCLPDLQVIVAAEKLILTLVKNRTLFCINGEKKASQALADFFYSHGFQKPKIINNYILMNRKSSVIPEKCNSNGLIFKKCTENDAKFLLPLELAYQKEEVLTDSQKINPTVCSYSLMRRLKTQIVFSAVKNGKIVAKAGTNALSWNYAQLGGIYTLPEYRRQNIAFLTVRTLLAFLFSCRKNAVLFVNEKNTKALNLYKKLEFSEVCPYQIAYFQ